MKIDVVYKLGIGSKHNDKELRYSLRSLSNFKDLGKVYIVGHRPSWITNIIHLPLDDVFKTNKDANLINKLILASLDPRISHKFLNFSDDQLLMRECSYEDFTTPYYDNSLINFKPDERLNRWKTRLKNTIRALNEKGLPTHCYEVHIPSLIDRYDYGQTVFQYNYPEGQGMCGNTLYFNSLRKEGQPLPANYALRLESTCPNLLQLEKALEGKLHFNYTDVTEGDNLFDFLNQKFPNKSNFEI